MSEQPSVNFRDRAVAAALMDRLQTVGGFVIELPDETWVNNSQGMPLVFDDIKRAERYAVHDRMIPEWKLVPVKVTVMVEDDRLQT